MSRKIAKARKVIRNGFEKKPDLRRGYQANIAMLIYGDQVADVNEAKPSVSNNLSTKEGCNNIADRIIELIFNK